MTAPRLGSSYVTVLVCQAVAAAATLASLRWLAQYVDPETFGRYALYQSVVSAGALLLVSWPNAALLRFGREEWGILLTVEGLSSKAGFVAGDDVGR